MFQHEDAQAMVSKEGFHSVAWRNLPDLDLIQHLQDELRPI